MIVNAYGACSRCGCAHNECECLENGGTYEFLCWDESLEVVRLMAHCRKKDVAVIKFLSDGEMMSMSLSYLLREELGERINIH
jgi:hypothetical protein